MRVGQRLDGLHLVGSHRLGVHEIESQPIGRDERALLRHVIAEHLAQRLMQQVRGRVIGADGRAARVIDLELDGVAGLEGARFNLAHVHEQVAELFLGAGHAEAARPWVP